MTNPKTLLLLLALPGVLPALGAPNPQKKPQKKPNPVTRVRPKVGTDWAPSPISSMALAKLVDTRLNTLKNTSMDFKYDFSLAIGNGSFVGYGAIDSSHRYRLQYPVIGLKEGADALRGQSIVNTGKKAILFTQDSSPGSKSYKTKAIPVAVAYSKPTIDDWFLANVRYLLTTIPSGGKPLESLVQEATSGQEYLAKAETRETLSYKKRPLREYRITITRRPKVSKWKGELLYEVVIGDKYFFPLSVSNALQRKGKYFYFTHMSCRWNNNPVQHWPPRTFDPTLAMISVNR